jgi:hypothetical protein
MIAPEPSSSEGRRSPETGQTGGATAPTDATDALERPDAPGPTHAGGVGSDVPLTRLRGATVDIDPRRARQVVVTVCLIALAAVAVILLIAGVQKNDQADNLHQHGVRVEVTVISCLGLLGGSGSNGAGYACKGTYTFDGNRYAQSIPGNADHAPGSVITGVIVPASPDLLSTPGLVARQQSSWNVFILPAVLFLVLAGALATVAVVRRRHRRAAGVSTDGEPDV